MRRFIVLLSALLAVGTLAVPAQAQASKEELKVAFRAREGDLRDLKREGRLGETIDGYVEVVDKKAPPDEKVSKLLSDENADRRKLYQIIAGEINKEHPENKVKATVETVAVRNARRNFERAGPTEWLRVGKDQWLRAKDFPRFEKLSTLKAQGSVGETTAGLVEFVKAADRADASAALVEEENAARTADYKAQAAAERVEVSVIAKRAAQRNFENARVGDMLKDEGGTWRKK